MEHSLLLEHLSYAGLFGLLAGSGIFSPIPEEIVLLSAGYFAATGLMEPLFAIPLAIVGILIGDSTLFTFARLGTKYANRLRERVEQLGLERTWIFNPKYPLRAVFILRFFTGLRMISPIYAGFHQASWKGFLLTTFAALLIFVPLIFGLGFYFHKSFLIFAAGFELTRHILFWSLVALTGGGMLAAKRFLIRRAKETGVPLEPPQS